MFDDERADRVHGVSRRGMEGREPALAATARELRRAGRAGVRPRRASGPRPVRPASSTVSVRPAEGERPAVRADAPARACPHRQRTLPRRAPEVPVSTAGPVRRLLAGLVVAVLAASVVVGLGQLLAVAAAADPTSAAPTSAATAETSTGDRVTVGAEQTVWDVARQVEPAADGPRLAALAERIVVLNGLDSVRLHPGQVLWLPHG